MIYMFWMRDVSLLVRERGASLAASHFLHMVSIRLINI